MPQSDGLERDALTESLIDLYGHHGENVTQMSFKDISNYLLNRLAGRKYFLVRNEFVAGRSTPDEDWTPADVMEQN